jgi:hypothetical protein
VLFESNKEKSLICHPALAQLFNQLRLLAHVVDNLSSLSSALLFQWSGPSLAQSLTKKEWGARGRDSNRVAWIWKESSNELKWMAVLRTGAQVMIWCVTPLVMPHLATSAHTFPTFFVVRLVLMVQRVRSIREEIVLQPASDVPAVRFL